jgi:hypothetical protein
VNEEYDVILFDRHQICGVLLSLSLTLKRGTSLRLGSTHWKTKQRSVTDIDRWKLDQNLYFGLYISACVVFIHERLVAAIKRLSRASNTLYSTSVDCSRKLASSTFLDVLA